MAHPEILQGRIGEKPQRNLGEVVSRVSELVAGGLQRRRGLDCVRRRVYYIDEIPTILSDIGEVSIEPRVKVQPNGWVWGRVYISFSPLDLITTVGLLRPRHVLNQCKCGQGYSDSLCRKNRKNSRELLENFVS